MSTISWIKFREPGLRHAIIRGELLAILGLTLQQRPEPLHVKIFTHNDHASIVHKRARRDGHGFSAQLLGGQMAIFRTESIVQGTITGPHADRG